MLPVAYALFRLQELMEAFPKALANTEVGSHIGTSGSDYLYTTSIVYR